MPCTEKGSTAGRAGSENGGGVVGCCRLYGRTAGGVALHDLHKEKDQMGGGLSMDVINWDQALVTMPSAPASSKYFRGA